MALSEREQQLLDELELSLKSSDANLASKLAKPGAPTPARVIAGVLVVVAGLAVLITGVSAGWTLLGALGFVTMFAGVLVATTRLKR